MRERFEHASIRGGIRAVRTTACAVHSPRTRGYTPGEHDAAMDRLLADIIALDGESPDAGHDDETTGQSASIAEPKLRLSEPMRAASASRPEPDFLIARIA